MDAGDEGHLRAACGLAVAAAESGGGPFGALVVRAGEVVGRGTNQVVTDRDPTAHAELVALRAAARVLDTHDLAGCVLYASCRPCPMCLTAAWWARVDRIVYAAGTEEAAAAGFDDARFWSAIAAEAAAPAGPPAGTGMPRVEQVAIPERLQPYAAWAANAARRPY